MKMLKGLYHYLYKIDDAIIRYYLFIPLGFLAGFIVWFFYRVPLIYAVQYWFIVSIALLVFCVISRKISRLGYESADPNIKSLKEIAKDSPKVVKLYQLAALTKEGYSDEKIIEEAKKHNIGRTRMKIALQFTKYPIRSNIVLLCIALGCGLIVFLVTK